MKEGKLFFCTNQFIANAPWQVKKVIKEYDLSALEGKEVTFDSNGYGSVDYEITGDARGYVLYPVSKSWCTRSVQATLF